MCSIKSAPDWTEVKRRSLKCFKLKSWKRIINNHIQQHYICSFTNGRNMHVYFLVNFHCLLDKEMEICYLHPQGLWNGSIRDTYIQLSHIKMHKRLAEALACLWVYLLHCNLVLKRGYMCLYSLSFNWMLDFLHDHTVNKHHTSKKLLFVCSL